MGYISVTFEQVASALESRAAAGQTISYNDFADEVGLPRPNNLFSNSAMKAYFEQIDADDAEEQRPFRTAVVVTKRSGVPGRGFFNSLQTHRGVYIPASAEAETWQEEMADLMAYYKPGQAKQVLTIELTPAQSTRLKRLCDSAKQTPELLIQSSLTTLLSRLERASLIFRKPKTQ